jgi:hypothetical protein
MKTFSVLLWCLLGSLSYAGTLENFVPCGKSNDCRSLACTHGKCRPTGSYNGRGVVGSECDNDSNCTSHFCKYRLCQPPKEAAGTKGGPREKGTSKDQERPSRDVAPPAVANDENDPVTLDACGKELRATVFADSGQFADHYAYSACTSYHREVVARARALWAGGYALNFTITCQQIDGHSEQEIDCAKKIFDALEPEVKKKTQFGIPPQCRPAKQTTDPAACQKDLLEGVLAGLPEEKREGAAKRICRDNAPETIERAKKLLGFGSRSTLEELCKQIYDRSDAAVECAKKQMEAEFGAEKARKPFRVEGDCRSL